MTSKINGIQNKTMNTLNEWYENFRKTKSDINEHLPVLKKYASKCNHITEMGSRTGPSTFTFLSSKPKKFVAYDIKSHPNIVKAQNLAKKENVNFVFEIKNVLNVKIEETDLLFIDTWHKYGQLKEELKLHEGKVKKFIIFHDTETYGLKDEPDWGGKYKDVRPLSKDKKGIWPAIEELLDGGNWVVDQRLTNNNGLTIIKRIKK